MLAHPVCFDRFELQPSERRLLVDGEPAPLGARAFDVLRVLVGRAGSLVSKAELLDTVWAGLVVEEANLTVQVSTLRKVLGGELIATIPGRGYRFTGRPRALAGTSVPGPAAVPPPPAAPAPVAAPSTLFGRGADLAQAQQMLARPGCVTLTGTAGVGKTSLARALAAGWPTGAVWVDLAPLQAGAQLPPALARALGVPAPPAGQTASLWAAVGERLLVLDNAEHLVDAVAALVAALLAAEPGRALLVTAQLPLAVPDERVHRVEPLALPDEAGGEDDALALFLARARAADHRFAPGPDAAPLLRDICRQLDGLPLALEMAAARVPALGLHGLRQALAGRFAVLTRGSRLAADRHRTLQAALDWSHGLLGAEEQRLFRALGVFAGGFTLDLVMAVAADGSADRWAVVDTLAALVDRSLVAVDTADPPRYHLLESLRAYALARLATDAPAWDELRRRHAAALTDLFLQAGPWRSSDAERAAAFAEHDNVREALAWATVQAPGLAVPLVTLVNRAVSFLSWRLEATGWLEACAAVVDAPEVDAAARADWWAERARQSLISGRSDAAAVAAHARTLCRAAGLQLALFNADVCWVRATLAPGPEMDDVLAEMQALHDALPDLHPRLTVVLHGTLGLCAGYQRDYERELQHRRAELAAAQRGQWQAIIDSAQTNVVATLHNLGRYDEALAAVEPLVLRLQAEDNANAVYALAMRSAALQRLHRHAEVRAMARELWSHLARYRLPHLACEWVLVLAREGRHTEAARLAGFLQAAVDRGGQGSSRSVDETLGEAEALGRAALGDPAWDRAAAEGRLLDDAAALALFGA